MDVLVVVVMVSMAIALRIIRVGGGLSGVFCVVFCLMVMIMAGWW